MKPFRRNPIIRAITRSLHQAATYGLDGNVFVPPTGEAGGWDVTTLSYTGRSVDLTAETNDLSWGAHVSNDGNHIFISQYSSPERIWRYDMTTPFDVSTATVAQTINIEGAGFGINSDIGITMNNAGTIMYLIESSTSEIHKLTMSTGFDLTTLTLVQSATYPAMGLPTESFTGIWVDEAGDYIFTPSINSDKIYRVAMSTPHDLSTATMDQSISNATETGVAMGCELKPDGTKLYILDLLGDNVVEYEMTTAFDLTTLSHVASYNYAPDLTASADCRGIAIDDAGLHFYMTDIGLDKLYEFTMS